jgi:hypothetical protein
VEGFDYGSGEVAPPASNIVEINGTEFARIPIYDIRFAAGAGSQNYSELARRSLSDEPASAAPLY